jgi:two-component system, cell cycle response regulator
VVVVDSNDEFGEAASSFNRLVEALSTSNRLTEGVTAMSEALASNLELTGLADVTIRELAARTDYEAAALLVVDAGRVVVASSYGIKDAAALVEAEAVTTVLRTELATVIDVPEGVEISGGLIDIRPREVRISPVRHGVVVLGVLVVASIHPSSREDLAVLDAALPGLAVALNNALNHERLQRVAALDPLTGIYNRRFGLQRLDEEFKRSVRSGDPLGVLMLDVDHFKNINDSYGHLVGDRVLKSVVAAARQALREGDLLARYGGEEFVAALPGASRDDVLIMAEAIRHAVADTITMDDGRQIQATVSVGGASLPHSPADRAEALIDLADQALYSAKTAGRNCSVVA